MTKTKLLHEIRAIKSKSELADIVKAQRISEKVLADAVAHLRTGMTELEMANLIRRSFVKHGAPTLSFPPIVAFGKGSADIHHEPGRAKLKKGDIVMFDIGCAVNHYCSDMTRTYFWGTPTAKQKKVYQDVLRAQELAVAKIRKGERRARAVDAAARDFLGKKYKDNFKHGLGHGVGTVIHEWPFFGPKSEDIVPAGTVMTVEPGIYLPGWGGVRIEDMYLITAKGPVCLTRPPKGLQDAILEQVRYTRPHGKKKAQDRRAVRRQVR